MIEYLHNAIRATTGEDISIAAVITNEDGTAIADSFHLGLYDGEEKIGEFEGFDNGEAYEFTIPADFSNNLRGRYFYCICDDEHKSYCFKQPIYFI